MKKDLERVKLVLEEELKFVRDLKNVLLSLEKTKGEERKFIEFQKEKLERKINETHEKLIEVFNGVLFSHPLEADSTSVFREFDVNKQKQKKGPEQFEREIIRSSGGKRYSLKEIMPIELEKETITRIRDKKKKQGNVKEKDVSEYYKFASKIFSKYSRKLIGKKTFQEMESQLVKANLNYTPIGYISMIILTTFIALFMGGAIFMFFLFFNFEATLPIITKATEPLNVRFMKVIWILIGAPILTFIFMYFYPALEKKSAGDAIDTELPFATINMAAIAGSMINPVKIFEIIVSTGEYPALQKEFTKMINEINLYGYDLVSALKNTSQNSPSKNLSELLNGLSTTIHSGGDLVKFFDKRAQTLLFSHKIEQQKSSKSAETTMDMYISIGIAAPMILMLLMMIMKISGLGLSMSAGTIALLMIMGVVIINVVFLLVLHMKNKK